jgi:hypothetical protein
MSDLRGVTANELARHASGASFWIAIQGRVYGAVCCMRTRENAEMAQTCRRTSMITLAERVCCVNTPERTPRPSSFVVHAYRRPG